MAFKRKRMGKTGRFTRNIRPRTRTARKQAVYRRNRRLPSRRGYMHKRGSKPARTIGGFPIRQVVKFRCTDIFPFTTTADQVLAIDTTVSNAPKNYVSIQADNPQAWDCYLAGNTNVQSAPVNWAKWAALYGQYRVLGSRCTLRIFDQFPVNTSGTGGAVPTPANGFTIGIVLDDGTAANLPATNNALIEQNARKLIKWKYVPPTSVNRIPSISMGYSPKKFWDVWDVASAPDGRFTTATTGFTPSGNVNSVVSFYPFLANQDNATAMTLTGRITVEYMVEFIDLKLNQTVPT